MTPRTSVGLAVALGVVVPGILVLSGHYGALAAVTVWLGALAALGGGWWLGSHHEHTPECASSRSRAK